MPRSACSSVAFASPAAAVASSFSSCSSSSLGVGFAALLAHPCFLWIAVSAATVFAAAQSPETSGEARRALALALALALAAAVCWGRE